MILQFLLSCFNREIKEAFSKLFVSIRRRISDCIAVVRNENGAEDVQDTFVKIYLKRADLKTPQAFSSWFYKILIRTALGICKEESASSQEEFSQQKDVFEQDMEITLIEKEQEIKIRSASSTVIQTKNKVVIMYYYRQFSVRDCRCNRNVSRDSEIEIIFGKKEIKQVVKRRV